MPFITASLPWTRRAGAFLEQPDGAEQLKAAVIGKKGSISQISGCAGSPEAAGSMWNFTQKQKTAEPVQRYSWAATSRRSMWARGRRTGWSLNPFPDTRFPSPQNGGSMWTISGSIPMSRTAGSMSRTENAGDLAEISGHSMESWPQNRRWKKNGADRRTKDWGRGMAEAFSMVKDQAPLVHMIANYVTASFCADAMAAMGARPLHGPGPGGDGGDHRIGGRSGSEPGKPSKKNIWPVSGRFTNCPEIWVSRRSWTRWEPGRPDTGKNVGQLCAASWPGRAWSGVLKGNSSEIHTVLTGATAHSGVDSVGTFPIWKRRPRF